MPRFTFLLLFALPFSTSCEKCKRCTYTYTVKTIVQTVNGEVEENTQITGVLSGPDNLTFTEECIKKDESFTIEQWYRDKKDTTLLDNFQIDCADF